MNLVHSYDELERIERKIENQELVIFLFVRPGHPHFDEIIEDFDYFHCFSGRYCSIYAIGYSSPDEADRQTARDGYRVGKGIFNARAFQEIKENLEERIDWKYSGETEVLILQNNPGQANSLNYQNYVSISIDEGLRRGYIDSFQRFMEVLLRSARTEVNAKRAILKVANSNNRIRDLVSDAISDCKRIPTPIRSILRNRLFYRTAVSFK